MALATKRSRSTARKQKPTSVQDRAIQGSVIKIATCPFCERALGFDRTKACFICMTKSADVRPCEHLVAVGLQEAITAIALGTPVQSVAKLEWLSPTLVDGGETLETSKYLDSLATRIARWIYRSDDLWSDFQVVREKLSHQSSAASDQCISTITVTAIFSRTPAAFLTVFDEVCPDAIEFR